MIRKPAKRCVALTAVLALLFAQQSPALLWAAEQAVLEGIVVQPDQVILHMNDQVRFNTFVTKEPPRLVIELLNTEFAAAKRRQKGQGELLKLVRSGQYQREPSLISRIVLDLKRLANYRAKWDGNKLAVSLINGEQQTQEAFEPEPVETKPEPAQEPVRTAQAPAPKLPSAAMPSSMSTDTSSELRSIANGSDVAARRRSSSKRKKARKPAAMSDDEHSDILAGLPSDLVSLDYDEMDIGDVLKLMGMKANVNIVYGSDVAGSITLHLVDVPFNEAFMTILSMQGLVANQVGRNILRVATPTTLAAERKVQVNQTRVIRLKYAKADQVKSSIDAVRSAEGRSGSIVVDNSINGLIVTDTLEGIAAVERLLAELDVRPQQVLIEAKLVEVSLTKDFSYGIQWDYLGSSSGKALGKHGETTIGTTQTPAETSSPVAQPMDQNADIAVSDPTGRGTGVFLPATNVFGAFTFGRVTNNYFLTATLTAAASQGKVKVLSDPKITTMNGKKATIDITTSTPYVTTTTTPSGGTVTTAETVAYQVTGISLEVTPTINADGNITLEVKPNVSKPSAISASAGTTGAIATDTRTAETTVLVEDGGTIVIGGLITDQVTNSVAKIPLLGDIPILGWLFKKKFVDRRRVELLIFVTTKIIH